MIARTCLTASALARLVAANPDARAVVTVAETLAAAGDLAAAAGVLASQPVDPADAELRFRVQRLESLLVPRWHFEIIRDQARNDAYRRALNACCRGDLRVLDIGTGSGLLAMMAAAAGARDVVACEAHPLMAQAARSIIAANDLSGVITCVAKHSRELTLSDTNGQVDVVVSELISNNVVGQDVLGVIEAVVSTFLRPGGRVIPQSAEVRIAPAHLGRLEASSLTSCSGFDLSPLSRFAAGPTPVKVGARDLVLSGPPETLFTFDFRSGGPFIARSTELSLQRSIEPFNGIVQWIRLTLDETITYENAPGPNAVSCWDAVFYPLGRAPEPGPVRIQATHGRSSLRLWTQP